jgi:hypothetical protein
MKHLRWLFGVTILLFVFSGCQKESINSQSDSYKSLSNTSLENQLILKARLSKMLAAMPTGNEERLKKNERFFLKQHPQYSNMVRNAITPTPCDGDTKLNQWINGELSDWDDEVFFYAFVTGMIDFPTYDALLFENSSSNQYFGLKGEHTQTMIKTFKDLDRFWDIQSGGIVLAAMHGKMLRDREKLIRIDKILYNDPQEVAEYWADLILLLLDVFPQYRNGDHPIFTFNAFAQDRTDFSPFAGITPDKIIMGDGILQVYTALGFDDVAPQAVLAHEHGHHIQFQRHVFTDEFSPEETRRTELMADAFSAFYLSHARGAAMQWKRVRQFLQVFYNIGDCAFNSYGHHGTPTQRMAAANWAYNLVNESQKQGHIVSTEEFIALFEAQLPTLITY